jgi:hypothetical protein
MFVVASKQHISAVGRWTGRIMIRHCRLGLSVSFLAVLAVVLTAQAVRTHSEQEDGKLDWAVETPGEQLGQEIELPPTPAYELKDKESNLTGDASASALCDHLYAGHYDDYLCLSVTTKVTDPVELAPVELASITQKLKADPNSGSVAGLPEGDHISMVKVEFYGGLDWESGDDPEATSYCFESKGLAADALRGHVHKSELAGETDNCYVAVYEGSGPSLNR